jgi:predicted peptidase
MSRFESGFSTRKIYALLLLILSVFGCKKNLQQRGELIETQPPRLEAHTVQVNAAIGGYYSSLPQNYRQNSLKYPLLVFLHGAGQTGNGGSELPFVLDEGVPEVIKENRFPPNFSVKGRNFSFIVLAPQYNGHPDNSDIFSFIDYAKRNYRIDSTRVYLSGLSSGGIITSDVAAERPEMFAAIVPISGISIWPDFPQKASKIAHANLPVWAFHNTDDLSLNVGSVQSFIDLVNAQNPATPARLSRLLPFGLYNHDAWTTATNPQYKENGMNMYEWMLQYSR